MKEPDLSDISLRDLAARHVKAGYSNVYKYVLVLEAELEQIKQRLLLAATAEVNDTGMGYTERITTVVEDLLSEWEITAAHEHILEETRDD